MATTYKLDAAPSTRSMTGSNFLIGPGLGQYGAQDIYKPAFAGGDAIYRSQVLNNVANYNNRTQSAPTSGGGGGGGGGGSAAPAPNNNFMGSGMSEQDYMNQVNSLYGESEGILNQQEQSARAGEQNFYNQYTQPFDAQKPLLDQAYQSGLAVNKQQQDQSKIQERSAIDAARRMYNDLSQGLKQRFGGANSAGEFANAFYGREFQRQSGDIQNTAGQNMQALLGKLQDINSEHEAKLQSLEMQKSAALSQAKDAFQQRIDAINNARLGLAQNKAQLKLQALQEFRQRVYQVQDAANAFAQQLQAVQAQKVGDLKSVIAAYNQTATTPVEQASLPGATYAALGGGSAYTTPAVSGAAGGPRRDSLNQVFA